MVSKRGKKKRSGEGDEKPPPLKTSANCRKAVAAYNRGDFNEALETIRNCKSVYGDSVFYHHAEAFLNYKLATQNEDLDSVRKRLRQAALSAYQAWKLFGNSIVLAHFCVSMMYIVPGFVQDHEGVIQQCQRALAMEDPQDPDKDSFIFKDLSQETEIKKMMQEFRAMIKQCEQKRRWSKVDPKKRFQAHIKAIEERVGKNKIPSLMKELEERRQKHVSKNFIDNSAKIQKVRPFWERKMSDKAKRNLFKVKVEDLKNHLDLLTDGKETDLMLEAIKFYKTWQTWKFWECCQCCERFADSQSYKDHLYHSHDWKIDLHAVLLPHEVDDVSVEKIMKGEWEPVDIEARTRHMVQRLFFGSDSNKNMSSIASTGDLKGSISGKSDLPGLLLQVRGMFQLLLKYKCLVQSHVDNVINLAFEELKKRVPNLNLDRELKNIKIICFLKSSELQSVIDYMGVLFNTFGLSEKPEKGNTLDEQLGNDQGFDIKERVELTENFSCLVLDEQLLREEPNLAKGFDSVAFDGSAITLAKSSQGHGVLAVSDKILPLSWLYAGQEVGEELQSWTSTRQSQKRQAKELFHFFVEERSYLEKVFEEKGEKLEKMKAVMAVESLWRYRSEQGPQNVVKTYASVLRERKKVLEERNGDPKNDYNQFELDFILNILEMDQTVNAYLLENLSLSDKCLQKKIEEWKLHLLNELQADDALIMRSVGIMKQYTMMLGQLTAYDYRSIMLPLLKSFIQLHLEELVHKNDSKEADANMRPSLKELDARKKIDEECDNTGETQGKSTEKNMKKT